MEYRKEAAIQLDNLIDLSNIMPLNGEDTLQAAIMVIGGLELSMFLFSQETEDIEYANILMEKAKRAKQVMLERVQGYLKVNPAS
mgnify:FL=1